MNAGDAILDFSFIYVLISKLFLPIFSPEYILKDHR